MLNYIVADFYRISKKKSLYGFLLLCSVGFIGINLIANASTENYVLIIKSLLAFAPIFIGGYVFSAVYTDDLRSKSLQTAIGFGKKRSEIVLVKFIDASLLMFAFAIAMLIHILVLPMILNIAFPAIVRNDVLFTLIGSTLTTLGFFAISSIAVFYYQKSTIAMTLFILLSTNTVNMMLSMVLGTKFVTQIVGQLQPYLLSNTVHAIVQFMSTGTGNGPLFIGLFVGYIVMGTMIASIAFKQKELEF